MTDLFDERASLARIRDYARHHRAGPYAVLGVVMLRAIAQTEPNVMIPAMIGTPASLNMFVGFVGRPGQGKGLSDGVGRQYWPAPISEFPIGTGEGLAATFAADEGDEDDDNEKVARAIFSTSEVDTLKALGERSGSTLFPELRKLAMGETIGAQNASHKHRRVVQAHTYRACLSVGIQPANAGVLLGDAGGGTPQRFVWLPCNDFDAPDHRPDVVDPLLPEQPIRWESGPVQITFPQTAWKEVDTHRVRVLRGDPDVNPLDGHLLLTRSKVAVALMLIEGRTVVSEEDWRLAGKIIAVSNRTRAEIVEASVRAVKDANAAKAHAAADREDVLADRKVQRAARGVLAQLAKSPTPMDPKEIRKKLRSDLREDFDSALHQLTVDKRVHLTPGGQVDSTVHPDNPRSEQVDSIVHLSTRTRETA